MEPRLTMNTVVDGCNFKRERTTQNAINDDSPPLQSNRTRDHSGYVNSAESSAARRESNVDDYSDPMEYEDVGQLGSNTVVYHELDPVTIGVPEGHVYSALNMSPYNNSSSSSAYEEIH